MGLRICFFFQVLDICCILIAAFMTRSISKAIIMTAGTLQRDVIAYDCYNSPVLSNFRAINSS